MLHPSTQKLIDRLAEMTERGKLDWTDAGNQGVNYVTEGYSVSLVGVPAELVITSSEGKELERATAQELADTPSDSQGTYASVIAALVKAATRIARGTETAISSLLADMDEQGDVPVEAEDNGSEIEATGADIEDVVDDTVTSTEDLVASDRSEATPTAEVPVSEVEAQEEIAVSPESESVEADAEPDMREAVARMANEVNGSEPDAANGDAAYKYVPFGLAAALATPTLTPDIENASDETDEDIAPAEPEAALDVPPVDLSADQAPGPDTGDTTPEATDQQIVPASDPSLLAAVVTEPAAEIVEETTIPAEIEAEAASLENAPASANPEPEPEPEPNDTPAPQNYNLSGIGAGFGFGALTATTEATDAPEATPAEPQNRIVIDATDEVALSDVESLMEEPVAEAIPEIPVPEQSTEAPDEADPATADTNTVEDPADLKPRTRFNPWT